MIRLLGLDLDGTLVSPTGEPDPRDLAAVRAALAAGVTTAIITGRNLKGAQEVSRLLPPMHLAAVNGAVIFDPEGNQLRRVGMTPDLAREVVAVLRQAGGDPLIYFDDRFRYHDSWDPDNPVYPRLPERLLEGFRQVPDLEPLLDRSPMRISIWHEEETVRRIEPQLRESLGERLQIYHHPYDSFVILEALEPESTKERALPWLANHLGIPREECAAIGDGINDRGMLRWAGIGVAMANAHPETTAAADRTTTSNAEVGVARAIAELLSKAPGRS